MEYMKLIIVLLLTANLQISAQGPSAPTKFDEMVDLPTRYCTNCDQQIQGRVKRFVTYLKRNRGGNVYIVHYRARVLEEGETHRLNHWVQWTKLAISDSSIESDDILVIDGGIRDVDTIELWMARKGSAAPALTPKYRGDEAINCPSISVYQDGIDFDRSKPVYFKSSIKTPGVYGYEWTVSDGKIIGGAQKAAIEVEVRDTKADRLTAFLKVSGVPVPCRNSFIAVADIGNTARLLDEFGLITNGDFKARFDGFFSVLNDYPTAQGFIHFYGDRDESSADVRRNKARLIQYLNFRRFDPSRFTIVEAGFREQQVTEFWLVPAGANPPKVTPSVNSRHVEKAKTRQIRKS